MSQRTILEINHDHIDRMTAKDWETIKLMCLHKDPRYYSHHVEGVRILAERHHSETIQLEVK